jgi:hypothetical protein
MLFPVGALAQTAAFNGYCTLGGSQSATSGLKSSNYLQGVIPHCTVTVYLTGTTNKATIYADAAGAPLTNSFTADALPSPNAGAWLFYAATGQGYDVMMSGGDSPNTYPSPVTLTDLIIGAGGGGSGCTTSGAAGTLNAANGSGGCEAVPADYGATAASTFTFASPTYSFITATAVSGDGTNITITAPNSLTTGQPFYISGFDPSCASGVTTSVASATSSQIVIAESDTTCTGVVSGVGGSIYYFNPSAVSAGFNVNAGNYGINLIAETPTGGGDINIEGQNVYIGADALGGPTVGGNLYLYAQGGDSLHITTKCFSLYCELLRAPGDDIYIESSFGIDLNADTGIGLNTPNSLIRMIANGVIMTTPGTIEMDATQGVYLAGNYSPSVPGALRFYQGATPPSIGPNIVQISAPSSVTAYNMSLPGAQGMGPLTNDGSGNLSWEPTTRPTGSCTAGLWVFSQDGYGSFCKAGTWEIAVTAP